MYNCNSVLIDPAVYDFGCYNEVDLLIRLIRASGGTVIVGVKPLDNTSAAVVEDASGHFLVEGLLSTVNIIGNLYAAAKRMAEFTYAMLRGIHSANTLVAHSDKAGCIRDMLRGDSVPAPSGLLTWLAGNFKNQYMPREGQHY